MIKITMSSQRGPSFCIQNLSKKKVRLLWEWQPFHHFTLKKGNRNFFSHWRSQSVASSSCGNAMKIIERGIRFMWKCQWRYYPTPTNPTPPQAIGCGCVELQLKIMQGHVELHLKIIERSIKIMWKCQLKIIERSIKIMWNCNCRS